MTRAVHRTMKTIRDSPKPCPAAVVQGPDISPRRCLAYRVTTISTRGEHVDSSATSGVFVSKKSMKKGPGIKVTARHRYELSGSKPPYCKVATIVMDVGEERTSQ